MKEKTLDNFVPDQLAFIKKIIDKCGPRVSGSSAEGQGAEAIAQEFEKISDAPVQIEKFEIHPLSFIGWIPIAAVIGFIAAIVTIWIPILSFLLIFSILAFVIIQFVRYKEWFDFLFPKAISQNVFSILEPPSGKVKYTLILSGHIDSSMEWPIIAQDSAHFRHKVMYGIAMTILLGIISLIRSLEGVFGSGFGIMPSFNWLLWLLIFIIPGFYVLFRFLIWDQKKASPGAMDNLAGISVAMAMIRYFKQFPEDRPKNCRIILIGFGAEEVGLRGSRAFVKTHKQDLLNGELWMLNIDGVSDAYHFNLMTGEIMLSVKYDPIYIDLVEQAFKEVGVDYKRFALDVGATDACTFIRLGKQAYTVSAQDSLPRKNYHTHFDTVENLDPKAIEKMNHIVLNIIQQIDKKVG